MWNRPLAEDDYDYEEFRDADCDDYDAVLMTWQQWLWEPYGSELDDGGNSFTLLRRPKWLSRYSARVRASERGWWADTIDNEYLIDAQLAGRGDVAEALKRIVDQMRSKDNDIPF